jgi:hypothetical protein
MKRLYVIVAVAFFGAVAGAHMITPAPGATASMPASHPGKVSPVIVAGQASDAAPAASAASRTRPPVPLLLPSRPPVISKAVAVDPVSDPSQAAIPEDAAPQNESFAKTAIEQDGYKGVRGLVRGSDGLWHGRALRGATEVAVSVDPSGNVSAQ